MKNFKKTHIAFLFAAFFCTALIDAENIPAFKGWKTASTNHFRFIYEDASRPQVEGFARIADPVWNKIADAYSTPPAKTDVLITGRTDTVNAYAQGLSFFMGLYTNPPLSPEFGYRENWQTLFFTHELLHIAHFSFEGKTNPFSNNFGPFWNLANHLDTPGWAFEGTTTVFETELTKGGRGRSPFFELFFKSATLENSYIHFEDIGDIQSSPDEIYIQGYLLMRSIADRFGRTAIADIERNRSLDCNFSESVKLVTGFTPEELFQDVRIALTKKYAAERTIPEGTTISPRTAFSSFYRPALISKNSIITIRDSKGKDRAAVRYHPGNGTEDILFEGTFADELSLTASENGTIVAALISEQMDRMPGFTVSTDLYTWNEKKGLTQLTRNGSLFQPSLSKEGNKLVAVELSGTQYRLVEVNLINGKRTVLIESENESFIQPALSADGSQIAFLILDGNRAVIATAPMPRYDFAYPIPKNTIGRVVNAEGPILDIAYPAWSENGQLLFASNERGRLEVWELRDGKKAPVVSDPVGAFWAQRTNEGIYYASHSSTGFVLKIKPDSEWGVVPDFSGPSTPGEIITLGKLAADFPLFIPFPDEVPAEENKTKNSKNSPAPVVKKRTETTHTTEIQTTLAQEKTFYNIPHLQLWLPTISYISLPNQTGASGLGAFAAFSGYPLQNGAQVHSYIIGGTWYPDIIQADAFVFAAKSFNTGLLSLYGIRQLSCNSGSNEFIESSSALISFAIPFYNKVFYRNTFDLALLTAVQARADRVDYAVFGASSPIPFRTGITASTGLDLYYRTMVSNDFALTVKAASNVFVSTFPSLSGSTFISGEGNVLVASGNKKIQGELGIRSRWFDLPEQAPIPGTLVSPKGESIDCLYPGRSIIQASIVIPKELHTRIFIEKLISYGRNSIDMHTPDNGSFFNAEIDKNWYTGLELEAEAGRSRIAFGVSTRFIDSNTYDFFKNSRLYVTIKLDALQNSIP